MEGCRGVGESKEHYQRFEEASIGHKHCLPFMTLFHPDVVIPPTNITLGKISGPLKLADDIGYKRKRVLVLYCELVQFAIVLDKMKLSILFLTKKTGEVSGDLEGHIYPFCKFSSRN